MLGIVFEPIEFYKFKMSQRNIAGRKRKSNLLENVPTTSEAGAEVGSSSPIKNSSTVTGRTKNKTSYLIGWGCQEILRNGSAMAK